MQINHVVSFTAGELMKQFTNMYGRAWMDDPEMTKRFTKEADVVAMKTWQYLNNRMSINTALEPYYRIQVMIEAAKLFHCDCKETV